MYYKLCACFFKNYVMFLIDTDGLSKIRLNYSDESAEGSKMLEDELIDFSEDQDNQVKLNAWQKVLVFYIIKSFSLDFYRRFLQTVNSCLLDLDLISQHSFGFQFRSCRDSCMNVVSFFVLGFLFVCLVCH